MKTEKLQKVEKALAQDVPVPAPVVGLKVQKSWVSRQLGAWKWANRREAARVSIIDETAPHSRVNSPGRLVIWESCDVCGDYEGGRWGYGYAMQEQEELFNAFLEAGWSA